MCHIYCSWHRLKCRKLFLGRRDIFYSLCAVRRLQNRPCCKIRYTVNQSLLLDVKGYDSGNFQVPWISAVELPMHLSSAGMNVTIFRISEGSDVLCVVNPSAMNSL